MIKNKDKIKSTEQLLNIVFENDKNKINDFYDDFSLVHEWEFKQEDCSWACRFRSKKSNHEIEVSFNNYEDENIKYGGEIYSPNCGEIYDEGRFGETEEIDSYKYKSNKTFYRKIRLSFLSILNKTMIAEDEDKEAYDNYCINRFGHSSSELTEEEIDELDGEVTYNMMVEDGWFEDDF